MKHGKSVAIVGVGGIFPAAPTLESFWTNITGNVTAARLPPAGRWLLEAEEVFAPIRGAADKVYSQKGCFVETASSELCFDGLDLPAGFLERFDPLFHLLLHSGRQAFADGVTTHLQRERVGVIIGNLALPSEMSSSLSRDTLGRTFAEQLLGAEVALENPEIDPRNRYVAGLPAGLLARALGLGGSSYTLDAACASSLYAIKLAVDELLSHRADAMLTGGLSRPDPLYTQMGFSQLHALSPSGTCSPFDAKGDGLVVGEGCGIFLLKRTEDAERDGDHIYAVIRGIGLSNDLGGSLLAPAAEGQLRAMRAAYAQAGWSPDDVDLIECHATGTPVGDAVEFASLQELWGPSGWRRGQCVLGSVKANIGHLLTAAGSAALLKTLFAFKTATLPPTANFATPAPGINLAESPFKLLDTAAPWTARDKDIPRRAAISAFGFGGINAHLLVEEWLPSRSTKKARVAFHPAFHKQNQAIAIVGIGAHFGPWNSLTSFAPRVLGHRQPVEAKTPTRWWGAESSQWFHAAGLGKVDFRGYLLPEVAAVPGAFRIPPKEQEEMLPRQLLMLQVAGAALQDAGMQNDELPFTGVFIGTGLDLNATNFSVRWSMQRQARLWAEQLDLHLTPLEMSDWVAELRTAVGPPLTANRTMGALGSIVASRVAKEFRIGGPSFTISSEENSGLRALEVGIRALQQGQINRALVGAVDLAGDLRAVLGQHGSRPFSATGMIRPFDKAADGTIIGEGAAAIVLKRLDDAQQDGDRIYAVIRGVGSAIGGPATQSGPDAHTYNLALERTFAGTDILPGSVSYLETHGSGCPAEDEVEVNALGAFFAATTNENPCYVGSVKSDIGDAGAAAGLASLVKATLALHRQIIPPLRNVDHPRYEWIRARREFILPQAAQFWLRNRAEGPRRALVSSVAVDGSAAHVLLEGYDEKQRAPLPLALRQPLGPRAEGLFTLEGETPAELSAQLLRLRDFAATADDVGIEALAARWWQENLPAPDKKLAVAMVAASVAELDEALSSALRSLAENPQEPIAQNGGLRDRLFYNPQPLAPIGKIAFVFPGSGNHFAGMGQELSAQWPEIFRRQDEGSQFLARQYLPQAFWRPELAPALHHDHNALVIGQVAVGTACSDLLRSFAIEPQAVSGYSLGESAGLFSLGAWKDRDGMARRLKESPLFIDELAGRCTAARQVWGLPPEESVDWVLGLVAAPAAVVSQALEKFPRVYLLIINTYEECVIGGDRRQLEELIASLGCHFFPLQGVTTVHCEVAQPVAEPYRQLHLFPTTPPAGIDFYSSAYGERYPLTEEAVADSILAQALRTVDYTHVIEQAYSDGIRIFLEMGPGNSCSRMIGRILSGRPHLARAVCYPGQDPTSLILRSLAQVISERVPVNLAPLYADVELVKAPVSRKATIMTTIGGSAFAPKKPAKKTTAIEPTKPILPIIPIPPGSMGSTQTVEPLTPDPLLADLQQMLTLQAESHAAYLRFSEAMTASLSANIGLQTTLLQQLGGSHGLTLEPLPTVAAPKPVPAEPVAFDRALCLEFAVGSIARVLGPEFAPIDSHPTRVRLPDEPLMLVDRIMAVEGIARSMTHGRVITEHDVTADRWYLDGGRIPTCVAVEAGQADLFLSAYLGIDFITKGQAVYRLLDAVVTFHRPLPVPGDVIRYDIRIDEFFRQDQTYLFRFSFEGTVNGQPLLSMQKGCAGFFSAAALAAGQGIVHTRLDLQPKAGVRPADWQDLVPLAIETYSDQQVTALYNGDLVSCFGPAFASLGLQRPYTLPGGKLKLVDRVIELNPTGGRYGLGQIRAEMDINPQAWFLTCHFVDDRVMPGTLMYECCMHTLRIYLLRMGWIGEEGQTWCEPVPGIDSGLKCRGQVTERTRTVTYQVSIKELGYRPEPYALVDALMFADGKAIVEIPNMSVRLAGLSRAALEKMWNRPVATGKISKPVLYDSARILAFAIGKPSEAFGAPYEVFDHQRKIARLPGPPFQFIDRITALSGEPWKLVAGATVEAEYDVPVDAWYFRESRQPQMPFSVLLEIGLQPCGWLAAYLGSALTSPIDLSFRNLDGKAVQHRAVTPASGTLTIRVKITRISSSGGMIIQGYDFVVSDSAGPVYSGDTVFGFFSRESLAQQVGVRDAKLYAPTAAELSRARSFPYPPAAPFPAEMLRMVDAIDLFIPDGGPAGLGFIRGSKKVNPDEWFFKAHFFEDPVCPGSLGLESFLQLLKVVAVERWGGDESSIFETVALGEEQRWNYRGQIIPTNQLVQIEAVITAIDEAGHLLKANGFLSVDGRTIYQLHDFSLRMHL
ncbi:MAG: beta-ketoacyl synthase N-terminal-like domain-containing protein [Desulfuromonadales bacterium]|nr:beta-ketoacyl synthase N-terminal-like domain-containing protein [Desulfuromonadales bacterium]